MCLSALLKKIRFCSRVIPPFIVAFYLYSFNVHNVLPFSGVHKDIKPLVELFEQEGTLILGRPVKVSDIDIGFGKADYVNEDLGWGTAGICFPEGPRLLIIIDKEFWDRAKQPSREELVFHELGHCILNREHRDDAMAYSEKFPASIMNSYTISPDTYTRFRDHYIVELFEGADLD